MGRWVGVLVSATRVFAWAFQSRHEILYGGQGLINDCLTYECSVRMRGPNKMSACGRSKCKLDLQEQK